MEEKAINIPNYSSAAHFLLKNNLFGNEYFFIICQDEQEAQDAFEDVKAIRDSFFPSSPNPVLFTSDKNDRIKAASSIYGKEKSRIIILPISAIKEEIPTQKDWEEGSLKIKTGMKISRSELLESFISRGYERVLFVENEGEFAMRGSVADFFCPDREYPERLYFQDNLESIKTFEISTQETISFLTSTSIIPINQGGRNIFSIGTKKGAISFCKEQDIIKTQPLDLLFLASFESEFSSFYKPNIKFNYDRDLLFKELIELSKKHFSIYVACKNQREISVIEDFLTPLKGLPPIKFLFSSLENGFICEKENIALITFHEITSRYSTKPFRSNFKKLKSFKFSDLNKGDFLVHEDFGIGKYIGIRKISETSRENKVVETECLEIQYARGDKLLVPIYEFRKVQKFVAAQGKTPKLSHMDTKTWSFVKTRVKKEIESIAKELLQIEAKRSAVKTDPLPHAGDIEKSFENAFPYEETPDQEKAILETLSDMENTKPMNRIIVGDVGFGKTEVAMRAAFRSAINFGQVCVLCPTTILAEQHYKNFLKRFDGFPIRIDVLSRLTPRAKAKKIALSISNGETDIVIGTHKLLQKNIHFKKLALLIIDEEHKFGVKDKEKLKNLSFGLHCLTLSATPIPRTLYQSLSSLKTMSVIESPPFGRLPVYTKISPYNEDEIKKAVNAELARNGQIYYVYNRVEMIESKKAALMKLLPATRIAVIHGQMPSSKIEEVMDDFWEKNYDILLASTIIESGIDIPSVNTLIIENAHTLGLAQLYQLRGRIGREKQKAYCYLFFPSWLANKKNKSEKDSSLSEDAVKRLAALSEFSELGSGFRLAMRDLEIRGAGELLGPRQHGFINSIGLDMYIKLLNGEIARLKGIQLKEEKETSVDINVPAYIPSDYIQDEMERLNYYKKILNAKEEELPKILSRLKDLSGDPPTPLLNLVKIAGLRKKLAKNGARSLVQRDKNLEVFFEKGAAIKQENILRWQKEFPQIRFLHSDVGDGFIAPFSGDVFETINKIL